MKRHARSLLLALLLLAVPGGAATAAGPQETEPGQSWKEQITKAYQLVRKESLAEALRETQRALRLAETDPSREASTRNILGRIHELDGRPEEAVAEYERALDLFQGSDNDRGQAEVANNLRRVHDALAAQAEKRGEVDAALEHLRQAMEILERAEGRSHLRLASYLDEAGRLLESVERLDEARESYQRALDLRNDVLDLGDVRIADSFRKLGRVACRKGDLRDATSLFERAHKMLSRDLKVPLLAWVRSAEAAGRLRVGQGQPKLAAALYDEAGARLGDSPSDEPALHLEHVFLLAGRAALLQEQEPEGSSRLQQAAQKGLAELLPEIKPPFQVGAVLEDLLERTRCGRRPRDVGAVFSDYLAERQRRAVAVGYGDDPQRNDTETPETWSAIYRFLEDTGRDTFDVEADAELAERARLRELSDANRGELEVIRLRRAGDGWIRFSYQQVRRLSPGEPLLGGLAAEGPTLYVDFPGDVAKIVGAGSPAEARAVWLVGGSPKLREVFFADGAELACRMVDEETLRCQLELASRRWEIVVRGSPEQLKKVYLWPSLRTRSGSNLALRLARSLGPDPWREAWIAAGETSNSKAPPENRTADRLQVIVRRPTP